MHAEQSLMLMLANMTPVEYLVDELHESTRLYKQDNSEKNRQKVLFDCAMFMAKMISGDTTESLMKSMEIISKANKANSLFQDKEN